MNSDLNRGVCVCWWCVCLPAGVLTTRLDHARVVAQFRKAGYLPLIKDYLVGVQKTNICEVNEDCLKSNTIVP